jgi:hypothetical protein
VKLSDPDVTTAAADIGAAAARPALGHAGPAAIRQRSGLTPALA